MVCATTRRGLLAGGRALGLTKLAAGPALAVALALAGCLTTAERARKGAGLPHSAYPLTPRTNQVDDYHGVQVADPYRWLEDENSPATKAWIEAQNRLTFAYLERIPQRAAIRQRLTQLWNFERYSVPFKQGGRYFYLKNDGLQNQSVLYTLTALDAEPTLLLDPNQLSPDGTVALSGYAVSEDGRYLAYGLATAGSDWQEWRVRTVPAAQDLADHVKWVKFSSASWRHDGAGFFYSRYDEPKPGASLSGVNYYQKLYYHRLGTPQAEDRLLYHRPDQKEWGFGGTVTDDGRYLAIHVSQGTDPKNRFFYQDLQRPDSPVVELLNDFDASYDFIDHDGPLFWFLTDLDAPRRRVIAIDLTKPARANWRELIPQAAETLVGVSVVNNQFIANYLKDAHTQIKVFQTDGKFVREISLPGLGSAGGFGGKRHETETFYSFTSFNTPAVIFRHDMTTGASTVFRRPKVAFDPEDYLTEQVFCRSKDGTRVPMFICRRKDVRPNAQTPAYLYGYGGFNASMTPSFSVANLVWMEMGGLFALANLRGGGEYGEDWHQAGAKLNKQNVFDDFLAAAEWLIANRYTSSAKLAIGGGSNGGLLVGACLTQRPGLFGAALPAVGVMDMLRFHKFTIGWAWTSDYGSADDPAQFKALYAYSPLHNVKPGVKYPATLATTADHDDRVVPAHSFKFTAALQAAQAGDAPALIRIETKAGHGAGKPTAKLIEEAADKWAFLVRVLGVTPKPR
jgi:prolyl oligopeptidase